MKICVLLLLLLWKKPWHYQVDMVLPGNILVKVFVHIRLHDWYVPPQWRAYECWPCWVNRPTLMFRGRYILSSSRTRGAQVRNGHHYSKVALPVKWHPPGQLFQWPVFRFFQTKGGNTMQMFAFGKELVKTPPFCHGRIARLFRPLSRLSTITGDHIK